MNEKIRKIAKHPLISGSFIIFAGGMAGNIFNFLFNLLMSRNLEVSEYGTLISLISLISLLAVPANCVSPTIVAVGGEFFAKEDLGSVKSLYLKLTKWAFFAGILFIVLSFVFGSFLSNFLNIKSFDLLFFSSIIVLISYIGTLNMSFMQAKLSFKSLSFSSTLSAFLKFVLGFILVIMLGFGIYGALFAYLVFLFTPIVVGVFVMRKIFTFKNINAVSISAKSLLSFGIPSAIAVFCLNSFISTDIILVKHLFSPQNAGLYAGLSLVGKIIFFITAPVMTVMFPIITNRFNRNEDHKNVLFMSMGLVGIASLIISLFYFLFPKFTILFFLKRVEYLSVSNYLGLFGIFITLYCMVSLLSYYFLSVKKTRVAYFLIIGAIFQAFLILIFHSDFMQVILISILIMAVLLFSLLYYYWASFSKTKKI